VFSSSQSFHKPMSISYVWLTNYLIPWSIDIVRTLVLAQIVNKFLAFYGTQSFNTVFTRGPRLVFIRNQMHPVHNFPPCFPNIHSNIILLSRLGLPSGLSPSNVPNTILHTFLISPSFHHPNNIWRSVEVMKLPIK